MDFYFRFEKHQTITKTKINMIAPDKIHRFGNRISTEHNTWSQSFHGQFLYVYCLNIYAINIRIIGRSGGTISIWWGATMLANFNRVKIAAEYVSWHGRHMLDWKMIEIGNLKHLPEFRQVLTKNKITDALVYKLKKRVHCCNTYLSIGIMYNVYAYVCLIIDLIPNIFYTKFVTSLWKH